LARVAGVGVQAQHRAAAAGFLVERDDLRHGDLLRCPALYREPTMRRKAAGATARGAD
jgi:hypothetical protein